MIAVRELPMFPLGTVLLPGSVLPLYLFEPRYVEMYGDIVSGDREFGVVLIERGPAAGGEDVRFDHGTIARMVGSATHDDGTISIVTVGTRRIRVESWLDPAPYPSALVETLRDDPLSEIGVEFIDEGVELLGRLKILFSELGADVGVDPPQLSDDPIAATYQMAQLAGLQAIDLQKVLEAESSDLRAGLVRDLLEDQVELVQLQLGIR
ncbi:MAG: LON peptidase substrate-binding domain-containing protein [Actinobacteria bacterium]|nr:LON peptidase substrate-binding domain-containing protein [Actinomycetota bacterium]